MLRILVTDDHEVVRRGICSLLQSHQGWEICGEAFDGRQAVAMTAQLKPDIVILDIGMPNLNGLDAARWFPSSPEVMVASWMSVIGGAHGNGLGIFLTSDT